MKALLITIATISSIINTISGHGVMVIPHNWLDYKQWVKTRSHGFVYDYVGMKSQQQCLPGMFFPRDLACKDYNNCAGFIEPTAACMWFTNYTFIQEPTLDPELWTYPHVEDPSMVKYNPWRSPGAAPINSPCGAAGGNPDGCLGGPYCGQMKGGFAYGPRLKDLDLSSHHKAYVTNWTRGEAVEVAWGIRANHGGGYSYRLCKMPKEGRKALTEECFQQTPLRFVGDKQWVQYGEDESTRYEFTAARTDNGTTPPGSQWTRNPIPPCNGFAGGINEDHPCKNGTQFPAPGPGLEGFGVKFKNILWTFEFVIIDMLHIPEDVEPGEYVVSFRWDGEQFPQVWNMCSSVWLN